MCAVPRTGERWLLSNCSTALLMLRLNYCYFLTSHQQHHSSLFSLSLPLIAHGIYLWIFCRALITGFLIRHQVHHHNTQQNIPPDLFNGREGGCLGGNSRRHADSMLDLNRTKELQIINKYANKWNFVWVNPPNIILIDRSIFGSVVVDFANRCRLILLSSSPCHWRRGRRDIHRKAVHQLLPSYWASHPKLNRISSTFYRRAFHRK